MSSLVFLCAFTILFVSIFQIVFAKYSVSNMLCQSSGIPVPEVAYCLVGLPHTFKYENVYATLKHNAMEGFGGNPHVFVSLERPNGKTVDEVLIELETALKFVGNIADIDIFEAISEINLESMVNYKARFNNIGHQDLLQVIEQYANAQRCYKRVEMYEKQHNMKFDWIMRVRSDMVYFQAFPPYCMYDKTAAYHTGYDHLNFISRQHGDAFFNFLDHYQKMSGNYSFGNAEMILHGTLASQNVPFYSDPIFMSPWKSIDPGIKRTPAQTCNLETNDGQREPEDDGECLNLIEV